MTVVQLRALPLEDHNCILSKYLVIINFEKDSAGVEGKAADQKILEHRRSLCNNSTCISLITLYCLFSSVATD